MKGPATPVRVRSFSLLLAGTLLTANILHSQAAHTDQVLGEREISQQLTERNAQRKAALNSYESHRTMTVSYDGPISRGEATETVLMNFIAPATKQFSVLAFSGSEWIRDNVFRRALDAEQAALSERAQRASALCLENYTLRLVGVEDLPIGRSYVLDVAPRVPSEFTYVGRAWIQATDLAVVRIHGRPAINPSRWITDGEFTTDFQKVGYFYFPKQTVSTSQLPLGMRARLTVQYGPYRILSARNP